MENFKGTPGDWSADIGADELHDDCIQVMVTSNENGSLVANAIGRTYDEAMANARIIAQSKDAFNLLIKAKDEYFKDTTGKLSLKTVREIKALLEKTI